MGAIRECYKWNRVDKIINKKFFIELEKSELCKI